MTGDETDEAEVKPIYMRAPRYLRKGHDFKESQPSVRHGGTVHEAPRGGRGMETDRKNAFFGILFLAREGGRASTCTSRWRI